MKLRADSLVFAGKEAVANGTLLGTTDLLAYDLPAVGAPGGHLVLPNTLASAYQGGGPTEQVTFNTTGLLGLYLELPGIVGEASVPGHAGVMNLQSFALDASGYFEVTKAVDAASQALLLAAANGTQFPVAEGLFYNTQVPGPQADGAIKFEDVIISSYQTSGGAAGPAVETVRFSFVSVPEPGVFSVGAIAVVGLCHRSRRARR